VIQGLVLGHHVAHQVLLNFFHPAASQ